MTIHWFPGHMSKARRQIEEKLRLIDVAFELLDARIPLSSRNPMIDELLGAKPRIVLLNKSDLADEKVTGQWVLHFSRQGLESLAIDAASGTGMKEILPACRRLLADKRNRKQAKGIRPGPFRALIVGIPNVGKSTFINRMAGRSAAATGDRPGVTKGQQWIKVNEDMELLDTPGILWPKLDDERTGLHLAATGAIREEILPLEDVAFHALRHLLIRYPERLRDRYALSRLPEDPQDPMELAAVMEAIGKKRGCLLGGGKVSLEKTAAVLLKDLRSGKLGRISLETPDGRQTLS